MLSLPSRRVSRPTCTTTQQTADVLVVSRPALVMLLESGQIPFERVDHRRKVLLCDALTSREQRRQARHGALARISVDLDDEDDAQAVLASLREARRVTAARRAQRQDAQQGAQQDLVADAAAGRIPDPAAEGALTCSPTPRLS